MAHLLRPTDSIFLRLINQAITFYKLAKQNHQNLKLGTMYTKVQLIFVSGICDNNAAASIHF